MYETSAQAGLISASPNRRERPLDRIESAADRVMGAAAQIEGFLARFHGHPQGVSTEAGGRDTLAVSYSNSLERLFANIETLESRVGALNELG